jgi:RNA-binding protein
LLGIPEVYTRSGYLVVKPLVTEVLRVIGGIVYDIHGRRVGQVVDVIGKVEDPRFLVKLEHRDLGEIIVAKQEKLYYQPPRVRGKDRAGR